MVTVSNPAFYGLDVPKKQDGERNNSGVDEKDARREENKSNNSSSIAYQSAPAISSAEKGPLGGGIAAATSASTGASSSVSMDSKFGFPSHSAANANNNDAAMGSPAAAAGEVEGGGGGGERAMQQQQQQQWEAGGGGAGGAAAIQQSIAHLQKNKSEADDNNSEGSTPPETPDSPSDHPPLGQKQRSFLGFGGGAAAASGAAATDSAATKTRCIQFSASRTAAVTNLNHTMRGGADATRGRNGAKKSLLHRFSALFSGPPPPNQIITSKYTIITFLPLNLYFQFRLFANIYFLCLAVLQCLPPVTLTRGLPTIVLPLSIVMGFTAIKDAAEDYRRHRADSVVNNRTCRRWDGQAFEETKWMNLQLGDIIELHDGELVPADVICVKSSDHTGTCFVETSNLDGETNLKERSCPVKIESVKDLEGSMVIELPSRHLTTFDGSITLSNTLTLPVTISHTLFRGCKLENTDSILCIVIYVGNETRAMMNMVDPPFKRSEMDRMSNPLILLTLPIQFIVALFLAVSGYLWVKDVAQDFWYLDTAALNNNGGGVVANFFSSVLMLSFMFPIAVYVSITFCRLGQAFWMLQDVDMSHAADDENRTIVQCVPHTSSLNDNLGQISHIFSDKTGTLTQNVMKFKKCAVAGVGGGIYGDETGKGEKNNNNNGDNNNGIVSRLMQVDEGAKKHYDFRDWRFFTDLMKEDPNGQGPFWSFITAMAVCHDVVVRSDPSAPPSAPPLFRSSSPDESALLYAARNMGMTVVERTPDHLLLRRWGGGQGGVEEWILEEYKILQVFPFSADRKRMSVIVRDPRGQIRMFSKGADTVMLERSRSSPPMGGGGVGAFGGGGGEKSGADGSNPVILQSLEEFSVTGLRTLVFAKREISLDVYEIWAEKHRIASVSVEERERKMEASVADMEKDWDIIAVSAIEDKLQDGVEDTIDTLQQAGITIWMLTGDKHETAINIGHSCGLLKTHQTVRTIAGGRAHGNTAVLGDQIHVILNEIKAHELQTSLNSKQNTNNNNNISSNNDNVNRNNGSTSPSAVRVGEDTGRNQSTSSSSSSSSSSSKFALVIDGQAMALIQKAHHALQSRNALKAVTRGQMPTVHNRDADNDGMGIEMQPKGNSQPTSGVVDGDAYLMSAFVQIATLCPSVICCRLSPSQKATIVEIFRSISDKNTTLAIGDGANDVAMIQSAHVGVGISGLEGRQAVLASDYSFGQFRFLKKMLLVHGHWAYRRNSKLVRYMFYKGYCFIFVLVWYCIYSGSSMMAIYEQWSYQLYSTFFTSLPIIFFAIFEQDVSPETIYRYPTIYQSGLKRLGLNRPNFISSCLAGAIQSLCLFMLGLYSLGSTVYPNGRAFAMWDLGMAYYTLVVIVVNMRVLIASCYVTGFNIFVIFGSILFWFGFEVGICTFPRIAVLQYKLMQVVIDFWPFHLVNALCVVACLIFDYSYIAYFRNFQPNPIHNARYLQLAHKAPTPVE